MIVAIGQSVGRYSSKSYYLTQTVQSKKFLEFSLNFLLDNFAGWDGVTDQGSFWGVSYL
jgi:hypothetical protein